MPHTRVLRRGGNESDSTTLYIARGEFSGGVHSGKVKVGDIGEFPLNYQLSSI